MGAAPADADLVAGLDEAALSEIFRLLAHRRGTALLAHSSAGASTEIFIRDGYVDWTLSNAPARLLTGDILAQMGATPPASVEAAFIEQQADDPFTLSPLGAYVVRAGHAAEDDIRAALTVQVAETTLRVMSAREGEVTVRLDASARVPFRAHLPIEDLLAETAERGDGFERFNPFALPELDPTALPPAVRNALRGAGSIRELANAIGCPEWALAVELGQGGRKVAWKVPASRAQTPSLAVHGLVELLETVRAELGRERPRETTLVLATRIAFALLRLERFYLTSGLTLVSQPEILKHALQRVLVERRHHHRYPLEGLLRTRADGGMDLSLVVGALSAITSTERRAEVERATADALAEMLGHLFQVCTKQILSPLDRRTAQQAFEAFRDWLVTA